MVECDVALLGFGLEGSKRRPDFVDSDILVEGSRVVERDPLKLLEGCGELVKLGQTSTSLSLDLGLD